MKPTIIYVSIMSTLLIGISLFFSWRNGIIHFGDPVQVQLSYITDFSDDQKLLGASHDVIVAKVLEKKGTIRFPGDMPGEAYTVQVLESIKGDKSGNIDIIREGGCLDGRCYVLSGDTGHEVTTPIGLNIGEDYIFAMRTDDNFGSIIITHPNAQILVAKSNKDKIKSLYRAYKNEIIYEGDRISGDMKNAFSNLTKEKKEKVEKIGKGENLESQIQ